MKKISLLVVFVMVLISGLQEVKAETIKMGFFDLTPHCFRVEGTEKPQGASIQYFESISSKMGYDVEWVGPLPFPRLIDHLKEGKVDGSLMMVRNDERQKFLYYPEKPYYSLQTVFAVKKNNKLEEISSVDDVKGYRIGYFTGPAVSNFLKSNINHFKMDYISGNNWVELNLMKLVRGRIDAIYDRNPATIPFEAKILNIDDKIKILKLPEQPVYAHVVFSKKSQKGMVLVNEFNKTVSGLNPDYEVYLDEMINSAKSK